MKRLLIAIWSQKSLLLLGAPLLMVVALVLTRPEAGPPPEKAAARSGVPVTTAPAAAGAAADAGAAPTETAPSQVDDGSGSGGSGSSGSGGSGSSGSKSGSKSGSSSGGSGSAPYGSSGGATAFTDEQGVPTSLPPTTVPQSVVGNGAQPPNAVSESPLAALIPVSFIVVAGLVFVGISRRRSRRATPPAPSAGTHLGAPR